MLTQAFNNTIVEAVLLVASWKNFTRQLQLGSALRVLAPRHLSRALLLMDGIEQIAGAWVDRQLTDEEAEHFKQEMEKEAA